MDFGVLEGNFGPAVPRAAQGDLESPPQIHSSPMEQSEKASSRAVWVA